MFSIIKKFQELFGKLKKNKGLFFTSLSILSIAGISVFIYMIMTMTSSIEKEVHESISDNYTKSIDNLLNTNKLKYSLIANTIINNQNIIKAIKANDKEALTYYEDVYNSTYKKDNKLAIDIKFYPVLQGKLDTREAISELLRTKSGTYGIEVMDNGVGMNDEMRERCLEPFYTTKGVGDGTGLGLSIIHTIVKELNNAALEIESKEGQGSLFRIIMQSE